MKNANSKSDSEMENDILYRLKSCEEAIESLSEQFQSGVNERDKHSISGMITKELRRARRMAATLPRRSNLLRVFGHRCFYCQRPMSNEYATFDHQIPKSKGGARGLHNLVPSCEPCNTLKADRMPTDEELDRASRIRSEYKTSPIINCP